MPLQGATINGNGVKACSARFSAWPDRLGIAEATTTNTAIFGLGAHLQLEFAVLQNDKTAVLVCQIQGMRHHRRCHGARSV